MKYKVGDKVKVVKKRTSSMNTNGEMKNIHKIRRTLPHFAEVYEIGRPHFVIVENNAEKFMQGRGSNVKSIDFAEEDLLITFENGDEAVCDDNYLTYSYMNVKEGGQST